MSPGHAAVTGAGQEAVTGLGLAAAAPGHARWSPALSGRGGAGRVITHDEHGGGGRAAAAGPGTRPG